MSLEEVLVGDKVLLTHIKVRDNQVEDKQLQLHFKGLSDVYVPHRNTYYTYPLSKTDADLLVRTLQQDKIGDKENPFYKYKDSIKTIDTYYHVVQLSAPRAISRQFQELVLITPKRTSLPFGGRARYENVEGKKYSLEKKPEEGKRRIGRQVFTCENFDRQARWNIGYDDYYLQPGTIYDVDDPKLVSILKQKRELEVANIRLKDIIKEAIPGKDSRSKSTRSNIFNRLRDAILEDKKSFDANMVALDGITKILEKSKYWDQISPEMIQLADELAGIESNLRQNIENYAKLEYTGRKYNLYLEKRPNFITDRQLNLEEWLNLNYCLIDIETPKFLENDYEIDQVSATIVRNQKIVEKRVYSKEKVNLKEHRQHKIVSGFETDADMIDDLSLWMISQNIDVLMAYNNKFDFSNLRSRGDFKTGDDGQPPKMDCNRAFFERFDIDTGFCMDLLRVGQTILRGFPNAKLEMFSRFLFGDSGYHKQISYEEMYELQLVAEGRPIEKINLSDTTKIKLSAQAGKTLEELAQNSKEIRETASELIIDYVCDDTNAMYDIFFQSKLVKSCLGKAVFIANLFNLDLVRLLGSPNSTVEVYDRGYFKHVGVHRDDIYPKGMKYFDDERKRNKGALKKKIDEIILHELLKNNKDSDDKGENQIDPLDQLPGLEIITKEETKSKPLNECKYLKNPVNGTFSNVERRFLPLCLYLKNYAHHATDKVIHFLEYIEKEYDTNRDPNELIFLSRYGNGLMDYVLADFGNYIRKERVLKEVIREIDTHLGQRLNQGGDQAFKIAESMLDILTEQGYFGANQDVRYTLNVIKQLREYKEFNKLIGNLPEVLNQIADANSIFRGTDSKEKVNPKIAKSKTGKKNKFHNELPDNPFDNNDLFRVFWSYFSNKRAITKVAGGYRIFPGDLERILNNSLVEAADKLRNSNEILMLDYPIVYTIPRDYDAMDEAQKIVPVQSMIESIYFSKGAPYYKEFGFYKGIEVKKKPTDNTNALFSNIFKNTLDKFLYSDYESGLEELINGINKLKFLEQQQKNNVAANVPIASQIDEINNIIYFNKSKNIYHGFSDGEEYYFALPGAHTPAGTKDGKPFFEMKQEGKIKEIFMEENETEGKFFDIISSGKTERVHIHTMEKFIPDYEMYGRELRKKAKDFAHGAIVKLMESKDEKKIRIAKEAERIFNSNKVKKEKSESSTEKKSKIKDNKESPQMMLNLI